MAQAREIHSKVPLPARYQSEWRLPFHNAIRASLRQGMTVLDVGSGRNPTLPTDTRPAATRYVGLDLSRDELQLAGPGAYDDWVVADLATRVDSLVGEIDLAVSWQVFEHVKPLDRAFANLHSYLKPGGTLVTLFSGKWSAFGIANQLLPYAIARRIVETSMRRRGTDNPVFRAYYDHCDQGSLRRMTADWTHVEITPLFRGATYFHFSRPLTRLYLAYENLAVRAGWDNLATHYLLVARR